MYENKILNIIHLLYKTNAYVKLNKFSALYKFIEKYYDQNSDFVPLKDPIHTAIQFAKTL